MENPLLQRFPGVIGFPVTPFSAAGELDAAALQANVAFLLEHDFAALAFCGSNGEVQSITLEEYRQVADLAGSTVGGKSGLICGAGQTLRIAEEQVRIARRAGADAVIVMAPYMSDPNEPGLAEYYRRVAGEAELPVVLYQTKWSGVLPLTSVPWASEGSCFRISSVASTSPRRTV